MREYDDDGNMQHYAPVLRRIIILVAVITAVPVMLWTITAFMHTYIAQPTIPAPRPLAAAPAAAAPTRPAADTATANPPAPSQSAPAVIDAKGTEDARGDRVRDSAGNNAAPNVQVASTGAISPAPSAAPAAPPAPAAVTVQAAPAPAPSVFPDPPSFAPPQQSPVAPSSENDAAADALPPPDPITGPVPLPRHRPSVLALADTNIPLPRARPGDAPEPQSVTPDAPPSGYDPGIGH
jgi:hypothetical protein